VGITRSLFPIARPASPTSTFPWGLTSLLSWRRPRAASTGPPGSVPGRAKREPRSLEPCRSTRSGSRRAGTRGLAVGSCQRLASMKLSTAVGRSGSGRCSGRRVSGLPAEGSRWRRSVRPEHRDRHHRGRRGRVSLQQPGYVHPRAGWVVAAPERRRGGSDRGARIARAGLRPNSVALERGRIRDRGIRFDRSSAART
jgi:hypothetical protein